MSTAVPLKLDLSERLINAALDLLAQDGTDAISLRAVARAAGVSAMAPYRHYPDKEALLAAVAMRGFDALRAALLKADAAPAGGLTAQAVAYVLFAVGHPALFRLMFGTPRAGCHSGLHEAGNAAFGVLARRVAAESPPHAQEMLTLGCWSLVHGLALLFLDGRLAEHAPAGPGEVTRRVAEAMLALQAGSPR